MGERTAVIVLFAAALLLTASPARAQSGAIAVEVLDAEGRPLPGVTVEIGHPTGYVKRTAVLTDADGHADFPVLRATGAVGPGYELTIRLAGFSTVRLPDVKVRVGETNRFPVRLTTQLEERVRVEGGSEVVDLEDTTQTTKFSDEFMQDLPVAGRFYQNVLTLAPGVQDADGDGNPNVHGSRDRDFKAEVSGVSNVDPLTGQQMSQINPNSIEEMEVITAGAGVEFSRAQGGFARILQKQGSNDLEGVVEFYIRSSVLDGTGADDSNNTTQPDFASYQPAFQLSGPIVRDRLWYRLSHEWIYTEDPQNTTRGISIVEDRWAIHSDQLTWQVSPRNKLAFQYQADPRTIDNFGVNSTRPEEAALFIENESESYALTWTAPLSTRILIDSRVAWQDFNVTVAPTEVGVENRCLTGPAFLERAQCFNLLTGERSGSYPQDWNDHRQRLTVRGDATIYGGRFLGADHQLKIGAIVENERYTRELERRPTVSFTVINSTDQTNTDEDSPERVAVISGSFSVPEFTEVTARGATWGLYAEDRFRPATNLTLTLGARVDREEIRSAGREPLDPQGEAAEYLSLVESGTSAQMAAPAVFTAYEDPRDFFRQLAAMLEIDFNELFLSQSPMAVQSEFWQNSRHPGSIDLANTNFAPRFSLAWDPGRDGKTKLAVTAGRYYDKLFLNIPLIELEPASTDLVFEAFPRGLDWQVTGLREAVNPALNVDAVDRTLDTPYQDEWTVSFERELALETSARVTYVNRRYRDQLQDIDINHEPDDYGRCVTASPSNPRLTVTPILPSDPTYDPAVAPGDGVVDDCIGRLVVINDPESPGGSVLLPRPDGTADLYVQNPGWGDVLLVGNQNRIDYEAVVFELTRRQYRNWEMQGSYTWSAARGDGEDFSQSLGDDRSLVSDEQGFQAYDQRHVVKFNATTITPWGFRLGGAISWQSGLPYSLLTRRQAFDAVPPQYGTLGSAAVRPRTTYPSGTRNDQRNDSYWNVDVKLTKELRVGRGVGLQLSAEVFNLLNDGTYLIYDPVSQTGEQINGNNVAIRRFGRRWQLGARVAF
ncbi:MAG TPA: TonB-dependent receptor [Candidatus Polarisedimenticolaceae bacterium]|nr:TonB-dependent receptor [Candidatus Polarisedimenticolaceae bacterium]